MIRNVIREAIEKCLKQAKLPKVSFDINEPPGESFGDYSTNIALKLSSLKGSQTPLDIANILIPKLEKFSEFSKVEFANPGFINFYIKPELIQDSIQKIVEQDRSFGKIRINKSKKARVEFVSANPTGPLHIGNARGGPLGDSIANIFEFTGYKVIREYYDNNIGSQVSILAKTLKKKIDGEDIKEDQYSGSYYKELVQKLKKIKEADLGSKATAIIFEEIMEDGKDMGIGFDEIQHEGDLQENKETDKVVDFLKSKKLTKEKEGAVWFVPNNEFLEDKESVLVRSNGTYTYFADDIAFHKKKFESGADLIINVLGSNHHGHVPRLYAAIKALGYDPDKYRVILYQYVRVKRGKDVVKMSKRAGNYVTAREVLDEVGKDAFRFFLLSHSPNTHMDFDLELAKQNNESNPVYYVQYAHARTANILKKGEDSGFTLEKFVKADLSLLKEKEELSLAKKILKLPELVEDILQTLSVHQLTTYSIEVADLLHKFYEKHRVVSEDQELTEARLNLILATKIVLRNTLNLIGVSAPERM